MSHQSEIWKTVGAGGKWTPEEVREALPDVPRARVANAMCQMAISGSLTRYDDGRYGVTHDCVIPMGVSVAEVLRVTGAA